jgi:hypothetical protein
VRIFSFISVYFRCHRLNELSYTLPQREAKTERKEIYSIFELLIFVSLKQVISANDSELAKLVKFSLVKTGAKKSEHFQRKTSLGTFGIHVLLIGLNDDIGFVVRTSLSFVIFIVGLNYARKPEISQ